MISKNSKILIVDDFEIARFMIQKVLNEIGYTNLGMAKDGQEAFECIDSAEKSGKPYHLVLCDWNMPRMNGIELLERCRATASLKDLPFVLITSEVEEKAAMEALSLGASDYIMKPFKKEIFLEKVKKLNKKLERLAA